MTLRFRCVKASTGFQLRQLDVIVAAFVSTLLLRNSMIRPSNFITTARRSSVRDWSYVFILSLV